MNAAASIVSKVYAISQGRIRHPVNRRRNRMFGDVVLTGRLLRCVPRSIYSEAL